MASWSACKKELGELASGEAVGEAVAERFGKLSEAALAVLERDVETDERRYEREKGEYKGGAAFDKKGRRRKRR